MKLEWTETGKIKRCVFHEEAASFRQDDYGGPAWQCRLGEELRRLQLGLCLSIRISQILRFDKNEPWETRSNTKQDAFNKEANRRAEVFLAETFCPQGNGGLSNELSMLVNRDQRSEETSEITGF